jgi:trk system potassium uptake protein TrkH
VRRLRAGLTRRREAKLRRALRLGVLGVDVLGALHLTGELVKWLSIASLFPAAIAICYSEPVWPFLVAGAVTAAVGLALERATRGGVRRIGAREGFLVVSLTWLLAAGFSSLVYILSPEAQLGRPIDAYFESMSGFTTTGATVLTDVESVNHSVMMWRQFSQWLGGMGIIVLALAVLSRLRVGGRVLMEQEAPGPELESLTVSIRDTARRLWLLYVGLTAAMVAVLTVLHWAGADDRMSFYEAVAHAVSTMPTGGFGTQARSIEPFSASSQWVIAIFMAIAGANFALMYRAIVRRSLGVVGRDEEFRWYVGFLVVGSSLIVAELAGNGIQHGEAAVRHAFFQASSMMTTTGYASVDFNLWPSLSALTLVILMFIGGCAASTGGAIKVVRHLVVVKSLRRELDQTVHPQVVMPIRLNGSPLDERAIRAILAFVILYVGIFALGTLGLVIESARTGVEVSPFDAIAAAATTLGNVGPAFGFAGPMGSFAPYSDPSKGIMIALMWLGRLELIPVVVLLTKSYWRA